MSTYTNLSSLSGLQVGDVVQYSTDTVIDFAGYKVSIELYSYIRSGSAGNSAGGKTSFDLDSSLISAPTFIYSSSGGYSLCYGSTYNAYKRIAVAGDAGESVGSVGGEGGGLTGGKGKSVTKTQIVAATANGGSGGSQSRGGSYGSPEGFNSSYEGTSGKFGSGGSAHSSYSEYAGDGGNGWYGGGAGAAGYSGWNGTFGAGGGGGSGFVIGQTTSVYPSGYMEDDTTLISQLESAVSNGVLTQGGASSNPDTTYRMYITIVSTPGPSTHESF